jgi:hypothetical protein
MPLKKKEDVMKKIDIVVALALVLSCVSVYLAYSQNAPVTKAQDTKAKEIIKTVDINNDGKPEVTYYCDGKYVTRAEADTNADCKPEIVVNLKDGKFKSAEAVTGKDGKTKTTFTDVKKFDDWLNETHPDFDRTLNRGDWSQESIRF